MIHKNITDLIGHTPLVELSKFSALQGLDTPIIAKVEFFNPGGSVKDRVGLAMIEDAERKGTLKPGATIIEPTSGNTGVGLALASAVKGYKLILTMPETMSVERRNLVKAYGAHVKLTPGKDGMPGAIKAAEALRQSIPGAVILEQFENPANPRKHYETTGVEIWNDTDGKIDIFVVGVGTGGTISGIGKYLKEQNPNVKVVAVEAHRAHIRSRALALALCPRPTTPAWSTRCSTSRATTPSAPVASWPRTMGCWWASHRVQPPSPQPSWPSAPKTRARPSWPCCPTPESATSRPCSTPSTSIRYNGAGHTIAS